MRIFFNKNKVYFVISLILIVLFFILWLQELNVFYVCMRYISEPEYKDWLTGEIVRIKGQTVTNVWQVIYALMTWPMFSIDTSIPGMDVYSTVILPVLAAIGSYHLFVRLRREYQLRLYRSDKFDHFILMEMIKESFRLSCVLFFAIAVNILIIFHFQYKGGGADPWRVLLRDIIPGSFLQNHPLCFYLMVSFIEHFITPLVWCTCLQVCAFYSIDSKMAIALPIIIYLAVIYLVEFSHYSIGTAVLYFSPQTIMASSYIGINTYGMLLGLLFPVLCGLLAYMFRRKSLEI